MYICPVCGWDKIEQDPSQWTFEICPQCGTEFGNDDYWNTHEELRQRWIDGGSKWWSPSPDSLWTPDEKD